MIVAVLGLFAAGVMLISQKHFYQPQQIQVFHPQVQKLASKETQPQEKTQETIDVSGWQTYRNVEYGFEVRFPANWYNTVLDEAKRYSFASGLEGAAIFEIDIRSDFAFREFAENLSNAEIGAVIQHEGVTYTKKSNSIISGFSTVVYTADRSGLPILSLPIQREILLVRGDNVFQFLLIGGDQQFNQHKLVLERMLAFFRFLDIPRSVSEIPQGADPQCITVEFRYDTDIDPPEEALPFELRSEVATIRHTFSEEVLRDIDDAGTLKFWFRITLDQDADPISFFNALTNLDYVDSAQFCSLPVPMLIPE